MAAVLQRATRGFAAVAVAATLVTVGSTVYERRDPDPSTQGLQDMPRPFPTLSPPDAQPAPGPSLTPDTSQFLLPTGLALPAAAYRAYLGAASRTAQSRPACRLRWEVLAAIGQVESGHAHGGALAEDGTTVEPVIGPALNGDGFAEVPDTDRGRLDRDTRWDRAVGPLQFIPATWAVWGTDGNGDGATNPHNVHDAALSAAHYLCAGGRDLSDPRQLRSAILSYNRSDTYADTVLEWIDRYSGTPVPGPGANKRPSARPSASESRPSPSPSRDAAGGTPSAPPPVSSGDPGAGRQSPPASSSWPPSAPATDPVADDDSK